MMITESALDEKGWINANKCPPPYGEPILIKCGDLSITDIDEMYTNAKGEIRWQGGGYFKNIHPPHRIVRYWKYIE